MTTSPPAVELRSDQSHSHRQTLVRGASTAIESVIKARAVQWTIVLPVEYWPADLRERMDAALAETLKHNKKRRKLKWGKFMTRNVMRACGRFLAWRMSQPDYVAGAQFEDLVTPDSTERFVTHFEDCKCAPATIHHYLTNLIYAAVAIAPSMDTSWLKAIRSRFPRTGNRAEKRSRIQYTDALVAFAEELFLEAEALDSRDPSRAATLYRSALQIMLLAFRPLRLSNIAALLIGRHLIEIDGLWYLDIHAAETKRDNDYGPPLPTVFVPYLQRYLSHFRKTLCAGVYDGNALWVSMYCQAEAQSSIRGQIVKLTRDAFGKSVCPHLFRDAAVTTIAERQPQSLDKAPYLLGNRTAVDGHYNQAGRPVALARYNAGLDELEDRTRMAPSE